MQNNELVKRAPVNYRYDALNWNFLKLLAEIAKYAGDKYGSPEQYALARLTGEKSPINHIYEHLRAYQYGEKHDHFGTLESQLAAVAYNAMMEYLYLKKFGHKMNPLELSVIAPISPDVENEAFDVVELLDESPFPPLNTPGGVEAMIQILKAAAERAASGPAGQAQVPDFTNTGHAGNVTRVS